MLRLVLTSGLTNLDSCNSHDVTGLVPMVCVVQAISKWNGLHARMVRNCEVLVCMKYFSCSLNSRTISGITQCTYHHVSQHLLHLWLTIREIQMAPGIGGRTRKTERGMRTERELSLQHGHVLCI